MNVISYECSLFVKITSSNEYVRRQSVKLITLISSILNKSIFTLIQPHMDALQETVAPRKHLKLRHYSAQAQIGILDAIEFCSIQQPQLFTLNPANNADHSSFFQEILPLCEGDESQLMKNIYHKNANDMVPLRMAALRALSSFSHLTEQRELILSTLHRALASQNNEIQQASFKCIKRFIEQSELYLASAKAASSSSSSSSHQQQNTSGGAAETTSNLKPIMQIAADYLREYLHPLTEYKSLNPNVIKHLSYITQLYPTILNEKFSEYLLSHLKKWLDEIVEIIKENQQLQIQHHQQNLAAPSYVQKSYANELKVCSLIITLLSELQSAPSKLVEASISLLLKYEKAFGLELNGQFRLPLSNFLRRYPFDTLKFLLHSDRIKDAYFYRFIIYLIKRQPNTFAQIFKSEPNRLIQMLNESQTLYANGLKSQQLELMTKANQIQFLTILIIYRLVKLDETNEWIRNQQSLIENLLKIWSNERFHQRHSNLLTTSTNESATLNTLSNNFTSTTTTATAASSTTSMLLSSSANQNIFLKEPIYLIKIFLAYIKDNNMNIELLFKLLIVYQYKSIEQYEFLGMFINLKKT